MHGQQEDVRLWGSDDSEIMESARYQEVLRHKPRPTTGRRRDDVTSHQVSHQRRLVIVRRLNWGFDGQISTVRAPWDKNLQWAKAEKSFVTSGGGKGASVVGHAVAEKGQSGSGNESKRPQKVSQGTFSQKKASTTSGKSGRLQVFSRAPAFE